GRAAFFPVFDQIGAQLTGPADAAFHEAEIEARVAPHQTTEENPPREGVIRCGEVANVVVGKVADGTAVRPAATARVLSHGDTQVNTALPEWIIIEWAVEGDGIDVPRGFLRIDTFRCARNRPFLVSL